MIEIPQINVGVRGMAQDLMMVQTGHSINVDIIVVSEQNRNGREEEGWFSDKKSFRSKVTLSIWVSFFTIS